MDLSPAKIPVGVAAKPGENPGGRRGTGSSAMAISRWLAGPKPALNQTLAKGKRVKIPVLGVPAATRSAVSDASG